MTSEQLKVMRSYYRECVGTFYEQVIDLIDAEIARQLPCTLCCLNVSTHGVMPIRVELGGVSMIEANYCPNCGRKLTVEPPKGGE